MRHLKIEHTTTYDYSEPVVLQPHKLLLRPREGHDIRLESSHLDIFPAHRLQWQRDVYDNSVNIVSFSAPSARLAIVSEVVLQHYESQPLDFWVADYAVNFPFYYAPEERVDLGPYLLSVYQEDRWGVGEWLRRFWQPGQVLETYVLLDRLNQVIADEFAYRMREEPGVQRPLATLARRSGSCRDYATLFIEACRYWGLAARFVSGYVHSPATVQGDGATHAWSEVYLPGAGWKGFDSTSGRVVGNEHIAVAVNRHPEAIPPVAGSFFTNRPQVPVMRVRVEVTEL